MSDSFVAAAEARAADLDRLLAVPALVCSKCNEPIATADELLPERVPCLDGVVWCYELDLLETTAHCYSATNPDDYRFDVARFGQGACSRLLLANEAPESSHSWFPPYKWVNASCPACLQQLGWVFHDETTNAMRFAGVIVTKMIERRVPMHKQMRSSMMRTNIDLMEIYRQHFQAAFPSSDHILPLLRELASAAGPSMGGESDGGRPTAAAAAAAATMAAWTAAASSMTESADPIEGGVYLTDEDEADGDDERIEEAAGTREAHYYDDDPESSASQSTYSTIPTAGCYCVFCGEGHPDNDHEDGGERAAAASRGHERDWQITPGDPRRGMCAACNDMFEHQRYGGLEEWYEYQGPADRSFFSGAQGRS